MQIPNRFPTMFAREPDEGATKRQQMGGQPLTKALTNRTNLAERYLNKAEKPNHIALTSVQTKPKPAFESVQHESREHTPLWVANP